MKKVTPKEVLDNMPNKKTFATISISICMFCMFLAVMFYDTIGFLFALFMSCILVYLLIDYSFDRLLLLNYIRYLDSGTKKSFFTYLEENTGFSVKHIWRPR